MPESKVVHGESVTWKQLHLGPNRAVSPERVSKMKVSICERGDRTDLFPLIVRSNGEIVDGQARWLALCSADREGWWVVDDTFTPEMARDFTRETSKWNNYDNLTLLAFRGDPSAIELVRLINLYGCSPPVALRAAGADNNMTRGVLPDVDRVKNAVTVLDSLAIFKVVPTLTHSQIYRRGSFVGAFIALRGIANYDEGTFEKRLERYGAGKLILHQKVLDQVRNFLEIYNFQTRSNQALILSPELERKLKKKH